MKYDPENIRKILVIFQEELKADSDMSQLNSEVFNLSTLNSKWIVRKTKLLEALFDKQEEEEILKAHLTEQIVQTSNEILPSNIIQKKIKDNESYKNILGSIKLLNIAVQLCDEAKESLRMKGYQIKNRLDWERWKSGIID